MSNISQKQIDTLQIILEDLKNHLTIIGGFVHISSEKKQLIYKQTIDYSILQSNILINQAISILNNLK